MFFYIPHTCREGRYRTDEKLTTITFLHIVLVARVTLVVTRVVTIATWVVTLPRMITSIQAGNHGNLDGNHAW